MSSIKTIKDHFRLGPVPLPQMSETQQQQQQQLIPLIARSPPRSDQKPEQASTSADDPSQTGVGMAVRLLSMRFCHVEVNRSIIGKTRRMQHC